MSTMTMPSHDDNVYDDDVYVENVYDDDVYDGDVMMTTMSRGLSTGRMTTRTMSQ